MARANPKPPTFTKTQLATAIKEDDAKRRSKAAAKRAAKKQPAKDAQEAAKAAAAAKAAEHEAARDKDAEQAAYIKALKVDAEAIWFGGLSEVEQEEVNAGERSCPEEFITAYVAKELDLPADSGERKQRELTYFGPMLALRTAAKTYVKAANGILCNGDQLAIECGKYSREVTVTGLLHALIDAKLEAGNRYAHMNPGQQSMNLRNRCRNQIKAGTLTMAQVIHGLEVAATQTPADKK